MSVLDEVKLVEGLKDGDEGAQLVFWRTYWDVVYPICGRMLKNRIDATDVSVDLIADFIEQHVHQLKEPRALTVYVRLMAIRRAQEVIKSRQKKVSLGFDPEDESGASPEEMAYWQALTPYLDTCLASLTPKARHALRLKYWKHLNNVKIGQILGGSKQYISKLVINCHQTLKQCIEQSIRREQRKGEVNR